MEYGANLIASSYSAAAARPRRKRLHHRHQVSSLVYINVNEGNGGIIRDLSETGLAIQSVTPLQADQQVQLRFDLISPRVRVETIGRVAWADSSGQAGIQLGALPQRSHRLLKEWIFTHILLSAQNAAWNTIFSHGQPETESRLQFSAVARPPIRLPAKTSTALVSREERARLHILGAHIAIQPRLLSRLLDGLIVATAALLFCVVGVSITHVFPSWPTALVLLALISSFFACLYGFLFNLWIGSTPGAHLARLASRSDENCRNQEERPRFR